MAIYGCKNLIELVIKPFQYSFDLAKPFKELVVIAVAMSIHTKVQET